ncbi:MAG: clostripain-related cysteine peptidase [Lachnospiraceae bacterium]|nr:clostripain-related cysteine peptidase [Lachnospiraceae bacterium]
MAQNFDPYTGQPLNQDGQTQWQQTDAQYMQPDQQYAQQNQQASSNYDPYTGQPMNQDDQTQWQQTDAQYMQQDQQYAQPDQQAGSNYDPYTGQPLNQDDQTQWQQYDAQYIQPDQQYAQQDQQAGSYYDPYTGQPLNQDGQTQWQQTDAQYMQPDQQYAQPDQQYAVNSQSMGQQTYDAQNVNAETPKKKPKKALIIAASIIGALGIGAGGVAIGMSGSGSSDTDKYVATGENDNKNNEIQISTPNGDLGITEVNGPEDKWTLMVYLLGSNLESEGALFTRDFEDFEKLNLTDDVNIIVQTGGTKEWHYDGIDAGKMQRFEVTPGGNSSLTEIYSAPAAPMATQGALTDFIKFCAKEYPAERYGIIMCDHGGGTMYGFGVDELFPEESLDIVEFHDAFADACGETGIHFDFIGFDACLMGTMEYAYAFKDYADYYLASEETEFSLTEEGMRIVGVEKGCATWSYTKWVDELCKNPDMVMDDQNNHTGLGRMICDNYFDSYEFYSNPDQADLMHDSYECRTTLSLIDLSKVDALYEAMCEMYSEMSKYLISGDEAWIKMVKARNECFEFGDGKYDQIDLLQYMSLTELPSGNMYDWEKAVNDCIVYKRNDSKHANGLAIYFPGNQIEQYPTVRNNLEKIGYTGAYFGFFDSFVARLEGYATGKGRNDDSLADEGDNSNNENAIIEPTFAMSDEKDGYEGRQLTGEQFSQTDKLYTQLLVESDGKIYYFGMINNAACDEEGFIYALSDGNWITIDGNVVYAEYLSETTDDNDVTYGLYEVPARYDGMDGSLVLTYNISSGEWDCMGWYYEDNLYTADEGDELFFDYICFDSSLTEKTVEENAFSVVAGANGSFNIGYSDITGVIDDSICRVVLQDIYGNFYFSEWF